MHTRLPLLFDALTGTSALSDISLDTTIQAHIVRSYREDPRIEQCTHFRIREEQDTLNDDDWPRLEVLRSSDGSGM
jgi:hypothetical protein